MSCTGGENGAAEFVRARNRFLYLCRAHSRLCFIPLHRCTYYYIIHRVYIGIPMIYLYIIVYSYCSTEYIYIIYNVYRFMRCVYTLHDEIHPLWRNPSGTGRRVCKIYIMLCCVMCISHI